jgi:hypothetical protein
LSIQKVIERVQKFLAVSRSDNEHEAALAASRAAKLMEEYNLSEAMLRVEDTSRAAEPIVDGVKLVDQTKKRSAWREAIATSVAMSLGCHVYISNGNTVCFGREGATQAWNYTSQYLFREVDRLADEAWDREGAAARKVGQSIRRWKNSFRVGAAGAIATRLRNEANETRGQRRVRIHNEYAESSDLALQVVEKDEHEVESAYANRSRTFSNLGAIGSVSSRTGYTAGREAGSSMALGGGRAALGAGQGRLK